ncbi:MAG: hypothetical protein ACWA47_05395 [Brevirhabdus sp.]
MLDDYFTAALGHLLTALFTGLIPVLSIALVSAIVIGIGARVISAPEAGRLFLFALFFALVGAALGLMLGASREPAVKAFLPAIITVLSGLFVYVFPKEMAEGRLRMHDDREQEDPAFVRSFVICGVSALMIGSVMGAFWGGSIRGLKEEDAKRYDEWKAEYETIELPLRLETLRKELGLGQPQPEG